MNRVTTSTASAGKVRGEMDDRLGGLAINLELCPSTQDIVVRPGMTHDIWIDAGRHDLLRGHGYYSLAGRWRRVRDPIAWAAATGPTATRGSPVRETPDRRWSCKQAVGGRP